MGELLKAGDKVGNYRIIEVIGFGGMGKVYKAKQLSMNRIVALKVLSLRKEKVDPMLRRRFVNEARTAGKIAHENVIHVYDVGKTKEELFFFSMEYIDGDSVEELLKKNGRFDTVTALTITRGVLKGLMAASKLGIIHRDIKPDNIIIARDGVTKLADLGLAKRTDLDKGGKITQEGVVMGTPHYMSPEQARGDELDFRTDIYSLGATLFHMLTGRTPYTGKSSYAIISQVLKGGAPVPSDLEPSIPVRVSDMIVRMMQHDPEERFKGPENVMRELDAIEAEASFLTADMDAWTSSPSTPDKKKLFAGIAGAVLFLLVALIISISLGGDPEDDTNTVPDSDPNTIPVISPKDPEPEKPKDPEPEYTVSFPYIYGKASEESGVVKVEYDFSYSSQLNDWFPDEYWRKSIIKREVKSISSGLTLPLNQEDMRLLKSARLRYIRSPETWQIIDSTLINRGQSGIEGFVNRLTFTEGVEINFTAEVRHTIAPLIIVSFMNNQMGSGMSFNLGKVSETEDNLFVISEKGKRKVSQKISVPFKIEGSVPYTGRIRKKGPEITFWINKGDDLEEGYPLFTTEVDGPASGSVSLWSNREYVKFYRVSIEGHILDLNREGWFSKSGDCIPEGEGYTVIGRYDAPAVLQYGALPSGKVFTASFSRTDGSDRNQAGFMLEASGKGRQEKLQYLYTNGKLILTRHTVAAAPKLGERLRGAGEGRASRLQDLVSVSWKEETVKQEEIISEQGDVTLKVFFEDDGISFVSGDALFYKDQKKPENIDTIYFTSTTRIRLDGISAVKRKSE